jgi:hypothetical protein
MSTEKGYLITVTFDHRHDKTYSVVSDKSRVFGIAKDVFSNVDCRSISIRKQSILVLKKTDSSVGDPSDKKKAKLEASVENSPIISLDDEDSYDMVSSDSDDQNDSDTEESSSDVECNFKCGNCGETFHKEKQPDSFSDVREKFSICYRCVCSMCAILNRK